LYNLVFAQVSWTHALRTIVRNCYKHHGREDLIPEFADETPPPPSVHFSGQTMVQTINNPDGTVSIIQIDTMDQGNAQVVTLSDGTTAQVIHTVLQDFLSQFLHG
jgi:nuclear respiratory factor 1